MFKTTKGKVAAVAVAAGVIASSGLAYAYWTTSGSGTGSAATEAGVTNELTITNVALTDMFPGDTEQLLDVTVENTSNQDSYVTTLEAYITTSNLGCDGDDFLLNGVAGASTEATAQEIDWTAQDIAHGATVHADVTNGIRFNNKAENQDVCKAADVTIHYVAS